MLQKYKTVSIVYGGSGKKYASTLNDKIKQVSVKERYPICSKLIMETILTQELLNGVINLFKESQVCVIFLTADDWFETEKGRVCRLRQNIVFELGMAILQLGRENCIILSDFDINNPSFELPSDMNSLEIRHFEPNDIEPVCAEIIDKILDLGSKDNSIQKQSVISRYDYLLNRDTYYMDYENLFSHDDSFKGLKGSEFMYGILNSWLEECVALPHYDEKCVYILERIGFLPIFGKTEKAGQWLSKVVGLLEHYDVDDVNYYGGTELLDFTSILLHNIVKYTKIKTDGEISEITQYKTLLEDFLFNPPPQDTKINPLMLVTYYDYLGLVYMRLYQLLNDVDSLSKAREAYDNAMSYINKVDLSLHIWAGFLHYNLARAYSSMGNVEKAKEHFQKGIYIRKRWLSTSHFNVVIRNALSYEYFIAKISFIKFEYQFKLIDEEEVKREYENIETELNTYSDSNDSLESLLRVRKLLHSEIGV